ncbi:MAG: DUF1963 domain-containing protein [Treponema sp.]|nr:DUF1963 domain-containing protein [Treponema sp.]
MEKLSLEKAFKNDFTLAASLSCVILGGIVLTIHCGLGISISDQGIIKADEFAPLVVIPMVALALFGLVNTVRRYIYIHGIFVMGDKVEAIVAGRTSSAVCGKIRCQYKYECEYSKDDDYEMSLLVNKTAETEAIGEGGRVTLLVDSNDPYRSIILSLYNAEKDKSTAGRPVRKSKSPFYTKQEEHYIVSDIKRRSSIPVVKIHSHEAEEHVPLTASKFGGLPYWNPSQEYPTGSDGKKLALLAQINMAEIPHLQDFPTTGLLQFFISWKDDSYGLDHKSRYAQKNWRIVYHETIDPGITEESVRALGIPTAESLYDDDASFPLDCEHTISAELSKGGITSASEERFMELVREAADELGLPFPDVGMTADDMFRSDTLFSVCHQAEGCRIGGYPYFFYKDPRGSDDKHDVLLFQMNNGDFKSDDLMSGETETISFFISREALRRRDFSNVICYSDYDDYGDDDEEDDDD